MATDGRTVVVTGATGFLGPSVMDALRAAGWTVRPGVRTPQPGAVEIGDLNDERASSVDALRARLHSADVVVHLAGVAHRRAPAAMHHAVNRAGAVRLARAARAAGVQRFVYLSSVKAAGEESGERPLTEDDPAVPRDAYGKSKRAAESDLMALDGIETVCLRPPLVHGPDARAAFAALMMLAASPLPLPFAGAPATRSLIARTSLCARIVRAAQPGQATGVFFVTDGPALTIGQIVAALRAGLGRPANLLPSVLHGLRIGPLAKLFGRLVVSEARFQTAFSTQPTSSVDGLVETARGWARRKTP